MTIQSVSGNRVAPTIPPLQGAKQADQAKASTISKIGWAVLYALSIIFAAAAGFAMGGGVTVLFTGSALLPPMIAGAGLGTIAAVLTGALFYKVFFPQQGVNKPAGA